MTAIRSRWAPLLATLKSRYNVSVSTVRRNDFNEELLRSLYSVSNVFGVEPEAYFRKQVSNSNLCHVFHEDRGSNRVLGFQCWHRMPGSRVIWGGKLRVLPEAQGRGLHLLSNLLAAEDLSATDVSHTLEAIDSVKTPASLFRVGLLNIYAFNAVCSSLNHFESYPFATNPVMAAWVLPELKEFIAEMGFVFDPDIGGTHLTRGQGIPDSITKSFGEDFWRREAVKKFLQSCPRWQDRDLFVAWEWDERNLKAVEREIDRKIEEGCNMISLKKRY